MEIRRLPYGQAVIEISKSEFAGWDERTYIRKLRGENAVFVTSDKEFVEEIATRRLETCTVVLLPANDLDEALVEVRILFGRMMSTGTAFRPPG